MRYQQQSQHPGGDLVLFGEAGGDATKAWEDVNHSDDAKTLMKDYLVGYSPEVSPRMISAYFHND